MSDYFHGDEDDAEQLADDMNLVVIDRDRRGLPCFGCYFSALFASFDDEQLHDIPVGEDVPDDVAEFSRRTGASFSIIADGMAFLVNDIAPEDAIGVAEAFCKRVMQGVQLHAARAGGRPN